MTFDPRLLSSNYFSSDSDSDEDEKSVFELGLSIEKLLQAFRESTDLYQAPLDSYGLRHDRFREWVDRHPTERLRKWAQNVYDSSRYVSHNEFFSKYDLIAEELLYRVENSPVKVNVYLYLGMPQIRKSNFWILLYLLSRMHRVVDYVITPKELPLVKFQGNSLIVIPDDAIYSGEQMRTQLDALFRRVPVNPRIHVFIASAFISRIGRMNINRKQWANRNIHFPDYSETFDVLVLPEDIRVSYHEGDEAHTIYFDHKLADSLSIYQTIYAIGAGLYEVGHPNPLKPMSLISNCEPPELIQEKYGNGMSIENSVLYFMKKVWDGGDIHSSLEICPFSPYKKKKYTLDGEYVETIEAFR